MKQIQLSITGCLGPCDIPNVISVTTAKGTTWYGNITTDAAYMHLLDWADRCTVAGELLPLPPELEAKQFERWQE